MPKIAISYRRADSKAITGRIYDRLAERYGESEIFIDIDHIPYGTDFRAHIDGILRQADLLIAVVGTQWRGAGDSEPARIFDEMDPVRVELQTALAGPIKLIPVLVDGAKIPQASELPDSLKEFAYRNALTVDSGIDFKLHVARLIGVLDKMLGIAPGEPAAADAAASRTAASSMTGGSDDKSVAAAYWLPMVVKYVAVPAVLLSLVHYLTFFKFNLDSNYLRLAAIIVPMLSGFLMSELDRHGPAAAVLMGAGTAVVSVVAMQTITALIDGAPIVPTTPLDWQVAIEFLASISLATVAGSLIARGVSMARLRNIWRIGS